MKIFPSSSIKKLDAYTIEHEPIASIDLMERVRTGTDQSHHRTLGHHNSRHGICRTGQQWRRCPCRSPNVGGKGIQGRSLSV